MLSIWHSAMAHIPSGLATVDPAAILKTERETPDISYRRLKSFALSKMATGRSMPVILKKFSQSLNPGELKEVQVSEKFRVLVALGDDSTLRLWNVKNDANFTLVDVIQYVNKDIVT